MKRLLTGLSLALFVIGYPTVASAQDDLEARKKRSRELAQRIDRIIYKTLQDAKIQAGEPADLSQLIRRLHVDLTGKIPTIVQTVDLIDPTNDSPTKLEDRIDQLLDGPEYANNFANYWRSVMLRAANQQQANGNPPFEGYLRQHLSTNKRYDVIAREIMNGPGSQGGQIFNQTYPQTPNIAGATARVFLGVKIECAECHAHPFAEWKQQHFWEFAAFFSNAPGDNGRKVKIPLTNKVADAKFLTGEEPKWNDNKAPRIVLADWIASPKNPYFAKAAVDYVWQYFFGLSLIDPIMEQNPDLEVPTHPELLDEMAKAFIESGFDLKVLIRGILLTDAYQRSSVAMSEASKLDIQMFAKMPVRGMTPEQLFDSLAVATEYRESAAPAPAPGRPVNPNQPQNNVRNNFLNMFRSQDALTETQTSILQALYLMNGPFVAERSRQATMQSIAVQNTSTQRKVEALYLMVLSRQPRSSEMIKMTQYIENASDPRQAVADICWVLLNSSEFMLNH